MKLQLVLSCYFLEFMILYGDGMCCTYGIGSVSVYDVSGNSIFIGDQSNLYSFTKIYITNGNCFWLYRFYSIKL